MTIGFSLFLMAAGAILTWAVNYTLVGIDIRAAGVILMIVGTIGLLLSLLFWSSFALFADRAPFRPRRDDIEPRL